MITAWMVLPLTWAYVNEGPETGAFLASMASGLVIAALLYFAGRGAKGEDMGTREAFAAVAFAWVMASLQGCLPFLFGGYVPSFTDAYFEAMSGFTTTGATIMDNIESVPHGILLWRSQAQWLGGMGIVVLTIALLPMLGASVNQLFKAEVPGPAIEKIRPRMQDIAILLWKVYMVITTAGVFLLMTEGMHLFDALCHVFAAVSTGGFSPWNDSVGIYNSAAIDWTLAFIMFFCGANFNLLLLALKKRSFSPYKDPEFRFYLGTVLISVFFIATMVHLNGHFSHLHESVRHAAFQVVSIITTTGFVTTDYSVWPVFTQLLLLFLMFVGGCAGSTAGGIKCSRILIVLKQVHAEVRRFLHPNAVIPVRVGNKTVSDSIASSASAFITLYIMVFIISALIVSATGQDVVTSMSGVAATLSNVGPGLGAVGPVDTFLDQHIVAKWVYIFCMLCGRLELYTVLILFTRDAWDK